MTHRERVLAALEHREPDRLPMDLGSARFSGMVLGAYEKLRAHLGYGEPGAIVDRMQQVVTVDERILRRLDVDVRAVSQGAPDQVRDEELEGDRWRDEWGVVRRKPAGCHYYELARCPLAGAITAADIARFSWPDPADCGRYRNLRAQALPLRDAGFAVMYNARYNLVHQTQYSRGFEDWFSDLAQDHATFQAMMEAVVEVQLEWNRLALEQIGDIIDIVAFGDDIGVQDRTLCSLALYRKLIRPYQERIVAAIRSQTRAKILYHTCGSVYRFIEDFIDIGIDALNPIQVTARNMEPERLKREFGGRIAFWGGIDSQRVLPEGSPGDVRANVRQMFDIMGPGGGYVLSAVHNVQPDVPPENVLAIFDAGRECVYGRRAAA